MEVFIHDPSRRSTLGWADENLFDSCFTSIKFTMLRGRIAEKIQHLRSMILRSHSSSLFTPEPTKPAFSVTTSSKGGIDVKFGSGTIHVRKYISAHHPLVQMLLFAEKLSSDTFEVPQTMVAMFKELSSSTSPNTYEAGWSPAKSRNAATPEGTSVESNDRSSEASLPVLKLYDGNFSDRNATVAGINIDSMITEIGCDLTVLAPQESLHKQNIPENPGASSGNTSIICSAHNDVHEIPKSEKENHSATDSGVIEEVDHTAATWLVASAAPHHATGNRGLLSDFTPEHGLFVQAGDGEPMQVCGRGSVITDAVLLPNVLFVPGLTNNLVSASQLTELDYCIGFARTSCFIRRMNDSMIVGKASLGKDGLFQLDYLKVPLVI